MDKSRTIFCRSLYSYVQSYISYVQIGSYISIWWKFLKQKATFFSSIYTVNLYSCITSLLQLESCWAQEFAVVLYNQTTATLQQKDVTIVPFRCYAIHLMKVIQFTTTEFNLYIFFNHIKILASWSKYSLKLYWCISGIVF